MESLSQIKHPSHLLLVIDVSELPQFPSRTLPIFPVEPLPPSSSSFLLLLFFLLLVSLSLFFLSQLDFLGDISVLFPHPYLRIYDPLLLDAFSSFHFLVSLGKPTPLSSICDLPRLAFAIPRER